MSRFTIKNLKELEDAAAGRSSGIEARFGRGPLESEHLGISYFRYPPGLRSRTSHKHREQEEAYVVVGGSGRIRLDDEVHDLKLWDVVRISAPTVRALEAGEEGLEIIAIGSDRPSGGDGEFVTDSWPE